MVSLKKISIFSFFSVAVLLLFILVLSIRQYQLTNRYKQIITQSEGIIFRFSTLREQITTSLISHKWDQVASGFDQWQDLNSSLAQLQTNPLIPGEYLLELAKHADPAGLAIIAKEIANTTDKLSYGLMLQGRMRSLSDYLIRFDRIIVSQMRAKVIQFQNIMIGVLAAIVSLVSFLMIFLFNKTVTPLALLSQQSQNEDIESTGLTISDNKCSELVHFTAAMNALIEKKVAKSSEKLIIQNGDNGFAELFNESTNLSNGIINYTQLLADSYREVEMGAEEIAILGNIMENAERIAKLNKTV